MVKPLSRTLATIWGTLGSRFGVCRRCGVAGGKRVPLVPLGWYSEGKSFSIGLGLRKIFDQRQFYTGVLRVGLKKNRLYETSFTLFGFPTLIVSRLSGGVGKGGHNGKNKFALKCISGNIKCFKNISFFFCSGNPGHRGPTQPAY